MATDNSLVKTACGSRQCTFGCTPCHSGSTSFRQNKTRWGMPIKISDHLLLVQKGRMLEATFNRPEDNGVSDGMARELSAALAVAHETSDMVLLRSIGPDFLYWPFEGSGCGPAAPGSLFPSAGIRLDILLLPRDPRRARSPWSVLSKAAAWALAQRSRLAATSPSPAATHGSTFPR